MALTSRERELVAVGISVAAGCRPCTSYHLREVRKTEATDDEIRRAIVDAVCIRNSATEIMRSHVLGAGRAGKEIADCGCTTEPTRIGELVSIGAAFAVNCAASLERHLNASRSVGVTEDDAAAAVELAAFIKKMAASHVERVVGQREPTDDPKPARQVDEGSCC
ncbi:MAG: carboxymuconolactone decarboxylase family protein [Planctomycetota bacterium]|jgi:AhpD family alkylhydroperoxidase